MKTFLNRKISSLLVFVVLGIILISLPKLFPILTDTGVSESDVIYNKSIVWASESAAMLGYLCFIVAVVIVCAELYRVLKRKRLVK